MTQDEIIEMARQTGIKRRTDEFYSEFCDGIYDDDLQAFAKLVAEKATAKEREACAKLVEPTEEHRKESHHYIGGEEGVELLDNHAAAIRARGKA
jgi:TATA-binding protein-associated factor Taf7